MNVDWAVAIGVFVMFVGWSFVYYTGFFNQTTDVSQSMEALSSNLLDLIGTDRYTMPAYYDSPSSGQAILYADLGLPSEAEGTIKVSDPGGNLDCMLDSGILYWDADLSVGQNDFEILYSDVDLGGCGDTLATSGANQTFPLSQVKEKVISQTTLLSLQSVPYNNFLESVGSRQEMRLEWSGPISGNYGPQPPGNRDVSALELSRPLLETGELLNLRLLVWE